MDSISDEWMADTVIKDTVKVDNIRKEISTK